MIDYQVWRMRVTDRLCQKLKLTKHDLDLRLRPYRWTMRTDYKNLCSPKTAWEKLLPLLDDRSKGELDNGNESHPNQRAS